MGSGSVSHLDTVHVSRTECKYRVRASELPALRQWLLRYCVPDENSRGADWYAIRSLYLDNDDFRLYRDAQQKLSYRLKLRARAYGDGAGKWKLEVKRRVRSLVVKTSASVPAGWNGVAESVKPSMAEFLQFTDSLHATPRMLVYYERQAFSSVVDEYVRVTFDRNVCCQRMTRWDLYGDPRAWIQLDAPTGFGEKDSTYIMEVKFQETPPAWLRDFVVHFGLERRGGSKYVKAMQRSMFYREPAWDLCGSAA